MKFNYAKMFQTLGLPLFVSFERSNISTDDLFLLAAPATRRLWLLLSSSLHIPSQYENRRQESLL